MRMVSFTSRKEPPAHIGYVARKFPELFSVKDSCVYAPAGNRTPGHPALSLY
jgi:hypothetical protein